MIKYPHFALNNLYLINGYRETQMGEDVVHEYEREEELEQCIRRLVLRKPEPLRGWDLRFLRRGLNLSQADFGNLVDRDAQTVARWEKSSELVPKFVDLMIRARFAERFEQQIKLAEILSFSDGTAPPLPACIQLSLTKNGWTFDFELRTKLPITKARAVSSMVLPTGHGPVQALIEGVLYSHSNWPAIIEKTGRYLSSTSEIDELRNFRMGATINSISDNPLNFIDPMQLQSRLNKSITVPGSLPATLSGPAIIYSRTLQ